MARFEILGPLAVRGPHGPLDVRGRQQRLALALLLVSDGDVSRAALIDGLWPTDPPPAARQTVESVVSRLRSALRRGSSATLDATPAGYRLVLGPDDVVDAREFATLAAQANAQVGQDPAAAAAAAREALSLWRGPALQDLADEPALHAEATRLDEERLRIFELWARAQIDLDLAQQVVPELSREAGLHPYRESLHMLLMLALYRCGRQADALATYTALRTHLADELGIVPGSSARRLQQQILEHDPALDPPPERGPEAAAIPATAPPRAPRRPQRLVVAVAAVALVGAVAVALTAGGGGPDALRTVHSPTVVVLADSEGSLTTITSTPAVTTRLATGADALWATAFDDGTLLRIDSERHAVTQTIRVGRSALGVAVAAGDVWVVDALESVLVRVDPETSSVVQRIRVGTGATEVAAAAGHVWIADGRGGTVTRVDAHTGTVVGVTRVGAEAAGIAADEHGVWVAEHGADAVARLDPRSGKLVDEVHVGSGPSAVAIGAAGVWVTNELDSTVSLIDPARDVVTLTRTVDGVPRIAAADARGLWVGSGDAPAVTRVGPDGSSRRLPLSAELTALARDGRRVLASVRPLGANHRGGTLSVRVAIRLPSADPYMCCDMPPHMRGLAWDGLLGSSTVPGSIGRLVPNLAVAIPRPRAAGRTYTFTLRPGLRYDTGAPVRARDVRTGLERAASSSDVWAAYLSALPGATRCPAHPADCDLSAAVVTDDRARTVTLRLARADPLLLPSLALPAFTPTPRPSGPVPATGPYRLARFVPDRLVEFRRNPAFRAPAPAAQPRAFPDVIRWSLGSDPEANVAAVEAGRADYTFDPPSPEQRRDIAVQSARQLHTNPLAGIAFLVLNTRHAPFDDVRVRRALNLATDRGLVARAVTGRSDAVLCQTVPRGIAGHRPYCPYTRRPASGRWRGPDLARARKLVKASGTAGATVDVVAQPVPEEAPVGRYFRGLLRRLGYRPHLIQVTGERRDALLRRNAPDAIANVWIADFPSAAQWITLQLACRAWDPPARLNNHSEFCDPRLDRLARAAAKLEPSNPAAAARLWARADRRVTDAAPWVPLAQVVSTEVVSRRVGNFRFAATSGAMLSQLWVR